MKALLSIVFSVSLMVGSAQTTGRLKIKIKKSESKKVRIFNQTHTISDTISLGFFNSAIYSLSLKDKEVLYVQPLESKVPVIIHLEPESKIKLKTALPDVQANLTIKGSEQSIVANEFHLKISRFITSINETEEKLYKEVTADGQYYLDSVVQNLYQQKNDFLSTYIDNNKGKQSLLAVTDYVDLDQDYELLVKLEKALRRNYSTTSEYKKVKKAIFKYEMFQKKVTATGQEAPILILPGKNGEDVSTQDLKGNYYLIDFWASWCKPCRAEHPRLTRLYEEYRGKGLGIYSVSLDKDKEKWLKAIAKDNLVWEHHVSNLTMFDSPAVDIYNVRALPYNVLVDPSGKVIAFNLRGEKLENKLKEIFNEK